jgi:arylformamidase
MRRDGAWYDHQYNNRARIPEHLAILQGWFDRSAAAREHLASRLDVAYGEGPGEALDVFLPRASAAPVLIYIHGGYWRALDKRDQSFVAPPFVDAGALVVLPNHALCPAVSVEHVVLQIARAVAWVYRHAAALGGDPARIVVAGHSAGGHLAAMMLCCRWPELAADLPARVVQSALSVSGVFELDPLRRAPFLARDLALTAASARRLSPVFIPRPAGPLVAVVGADESEEFIRQHRRLARAWGRPGVPVCETVPGRHHMNVLHDLAEPSSRVHQSALELLGLPLPANRAAPGPSLHRAG